MFGTLRRFRVWKGQFLKKRVQELKQYVKGIDAAFPSGVILSIAKENAEFDPKNNRIKLFINTETAKVIDGQHRIEGLRGYVGPTFEVCCAIFIDMEPEDQAIVFSTINLKQVSVNPSITYDLLEYAASRSPQKTCHGIARALNVAPGSPFKDRIMILGTADDKERETLTQAAFIKPLLRLITKPEMAIDDRNALKSGAGLRIPTLEEVRVNSWIFRRWFIQAMDDKITQVLVNYFHAVGKKWPIAWGTKTPGLILNRTNGYNALMRFLAPVTFKLGLDEIHKTNSYLEIFDRVQLTDLEINAEMFPPGSTGEGRLFRKLLADSEIPEKQAWVTPRLK